MIRGKQYIQTVEGLKRFIEDLQTLNLPEHGVVIEVKTGVRTTRQNSAMHKYFQLLADAFNDAGLDMKKVIKPEVDIPWTPATVKEYLWRPIQKAVTKKDSSTKLDISEVSEVFETLHRHLASKFGILVMFPSEDSR